MQEKNHVVLFIQNIYGKKKWDGVNLLTNSAGGTSHFFVFRRTPRVDCGPGKSGTSHFFFPVDICGAKWMLFLSGLY